VAAPRGRLVLIRPDGTEGGTHPLHDGETLIGRGQGTLFEADARRGGADTAGGSLDGVACRRGAGAM